MVSVDCFKGGAVQEISSYSKFEAIHELVQKAKVFTGIKDRTLLEEAVVRRECTLSTACGHGTAFAHGKTHLVKDISICLGISRKGIHYGSPDGKPVHFLFIIITPHECQCDYLVTLSTLARIFYKECITKSELVNLSIQDIEKRIAALFEVTLKNTKVKVGNQL